MDSHDPSHVLIADDESGFRSMLGWALAKHGIRVYTVPDGAQAVDCLQDHFFHVLVTDLSMPGIQGLKLLEKSRELSPKTRVIIITGFSTVETAVQAMRDGAYDFVLKPFNLSQLVARIRQAAGLAASADPDGGAEAA